MERNREGERATVEKELRKPWSCELLVAYVPLGLCPQKITRFFTIVVVENILIVLSRGLKTIYVQSAICVRVCSILT